MDQERPARLPPPPAPACGPLPPPPPPRPVDPLATPDGWGWQELCDGDEPPPLPLAAPTPRSGRWRLVTGAVVVALALGWWAAADRGGVERDVVTSDTPATITGAESH